MKINRYYFPQYWPVWFLIFIFWLVVQLPYRWQLSLGKYLGLLIMKIAKKSKRIAQINLALCFPELSKELREELLQKSFINIGIAIFETGMGFWSSTKQIEPLVNLINYDEVDKIQATGRGVLVLGGHFTTLEIVGRVCAMKHQFSVMYRPNKIGIIDFFLKKVLSKYYHRAIPRHNLRTMINTLKEGGAVWYSPDVNADRKASVFAPFFGTQAATVKAVTRFVELTGCAVVPLSHYRRDDNTGYDVILSSPLELSSTHDYVEDATRINKILEEAVRKKPEQYLWQYMRFKTRPEGEPRIYSQHFPGID